MDSLIEAGRVPPLLLQVMQRLARRTYEHLATCSSCAAAVGRAAPGVPPQDALCLELQATYQALGELGALIVDPDSGELGPMARRVES